jgi:hypothetical protein
MYPKKIEDEQTRLRHRIIRMRAMLCFAKDPRAEAGMRELIDDAEARLTAVEGKAEPQMNGSQTPAAGKDAALASQRLPVTPG